MQKYTLGFIFTPDLKEVLLIHKISPVWQKGKVNGIGGKVEAGEEAVVGIVREVCEETALEIPKEQWVSVATLIENEAEVYVYTCVYTGEKHHARRNDKEEIEWVKTTSLPTNALSNLRWLIPLSLDKLQYNLFDKVRVTYR